MIVFWSILILFIGFLIWLLVAPISLNIDSTKNKYQVTWKGIAKLALIPADEEWFFNLKIGFWQKQFFFSNLINDFKSKSEKPKVQKDKQPKKKKNRFFTFKKFRRLIKSFRLKVCKVNLDTDDYYLNALLFPVYSIVNKGNQHQLNVNFQSRNDILLVIENRLGRIIYSILF